MALDPDKFRQSRHSRPSAGVAAASTGPLHFIHHSDLVYTLDGKPHPPEAIGLEERNGVKASDILLVVPMRNAKNDDSPMVLDQEKLKQAKAFTRRYVTSQLHVTLEEDHETTLPEMCPHDYTPGYLALYNKTHAGADPDVRLKVLNREVDNKLKSITPAAINEDKDDVWQESFRLRTRGFSGANALIALMFLEPNEAGAPKKSGNEKAVNSAFEHLPEWVQVLTHEHGAYVLTTNVPEMRRIARGAALGGLADKMATIYLKSNFSSREEQPRISILSEELVHELQRRTDTEEIYKAADEDSCEPLRSDRWNKAAETLIRRIDSKAAKKQIDPAFALIEKTEPKGGSLMLPQFKEHMEVRGAELLVDVYDAESYLRRDKALGGEGKSKKEAEKILKSTFGEEVFSLSREYLTAWMGEAEKILEKKLNNETKGEKAAHYRKKWEEAPLTHSIDLTQLPEYKVSGTELPAH